MADKFNLADLIKKLKITEESDNGLLDFEFVSIDLVSGEKVIEKIEETDSYSVSLEIYLKKPTLVTKVAKHFTHFINWKDSNIPSFPDSPFYKKLIYGADVPGRAYSIGNDGIDNKYLMVGHQIDKAIENVKKCDCIIIDSFQNNALTILKEYAESFGKPVKLKLYKGRNINSVV